jgi:hypothetical protein
VRRWDKGSSSITEREIQTSFVKGCVMSGFGALVSHYFGGSRYDGWIEWLGGRRGGGRERIIRRLIRSVQFSK